MFKELLININIMDDNNDNYESLNQETLKKIQISSQEHMLIKSLEKFYNNKLFSIIYVLYF